MRVFGLDDNNKDGNVLFEIEIKKYIHVRENVFKFETNDEIVKYSSEHGHNDVKNPLAHGKENIYFIPHKKYIPIQGYENSTMKNESRYLYKKYDDLKGGDDEGIVEYSKDFLNCKIIHSKQ